MSREDPYQYQIPPQPLQQHDFQSMNPKWTEPSVVQADYPVTYPEDVIVEQPIPYLYWYGAATTIKEKSTFLLFFIVVLASFCGVCGCLGGLICLIPAAVVASLALSNATTGEEGVALAFIRMAKRLAIAGLVVGSLFFFISIIIIIGNLRSVQTK